MAPKLVEAGRLGGGRVWNFPFTEDYDADIESKVADAGAVRGPWQGRSRPRFPLVWDVPYLRTLPGRTSDLARPPAAGPGARDYPDVTGFGVRFALELLLKQNLLAELGKCRLKSLRLARPDDWHLHLRDGAAPWLPCCR